MLPRDTMVAGYRIDGVLGQGGMAIVYAALQLSLNRTVALKVLSPKLSEDPSFRERFRREGLVQAAVDHPHILPVYEAGEWEGSLFLSMRMVRGPTLKDMILSRVLDPPRTVRILRPIGDALDAAHEVNLVHRDITPQNVLVGGGDHAYLADFGLTKMVGERGLTSSGQFVGTIDYVSPEQVRSRHPTTASDVYGLGAVVYECLTGAVPFPRDSEAEVLYAHVAEAPTPVSELRPQLPAALDEVLERAMAKDPEQRHRSAGELMREVERALAGQAAGALGPPPPLRGPQDAGIRAAGPTQPGGEAPPPEAAGAGAAAYGGAHGPATEAVASAATAEAPVAATAAPSAAGPPASARRRLRRSTAVLVAAALGAGAGAGAGAATGAGAGSGDAPGLRRVSAPDGYVSIGLPAGWRRVARPRRIPGLPFDRPLGAAPAGSRRGAGLVAGTVTTAGPTLLPSAFLERIGGPPRRKDRVRVGDLAGYRYERLRPRRFRALVTVYVVPTTTRVATVACYARRPAPPGFSSACERAAATLELANTLPMGLEPNKAYAFRLSAASAVVNDARKAGRAAMQSAPGWLEQSRAARRMALGAGRAAKILERGDISVAARPVNTKIARRLRSLEAACGELKAAAEQQDRRRFAKAAGRVRQAEEGVQQAFEALEPLGYEVV